MVLLRVLSSESVYNRPTIARFITSGKKGDVDEEQNMHKWMKLREPLLGNLAIIPHRDTRTTTELLHSSVWRTIAVKFLTNRMPLYLKRDKS